MSRLAHLVSHHPVWVLLAVAAITAAALAAIIDPRSGALRIWIDPSVNRLLPEDDEERLFYERVRHIFGDEAAVIVAVASREVFTLENLRRVERLTERFRDLPGVHRVLSLATAPNLRSDERGVEVRTFTHGAFATPEELERLRADVFANPLYRGTLVSDDARVTAIIVSFKGLSDRDFLERRLAARIEAIADEERGDVEVWVTGSPILKAATSDALLGSLARVVPATVGVASLVLLLAFGSLRGVLLPVTTIALALTWTLGALAWLGRPLGLVTSIVPPLIITVGLAYAMHVLAEYVRTFRDEEAGDFRDESERIQRGLAAVSGPVAITGLTTAAGLLALVLSPLAAIREFGLLGALGVFVSVVLSLSFIPACLRLLGGARPMRPPPGEALLERVSERIVHFDLRHRRLILGGGLVVLAVALVGAAGIRVGTEYVRNFPSDSAVRVQYEAVNRAFGGANPFYIVVETNLADAFAHPDLLRELESLQEWLERQPEIGTTTSVVDHLKLINRSLHGDAKHFAIPESQLLAKQLLVFGGGEDIGGFVDSRFHSANVVVRTNVSDSASVASLLAKIEARLAELSLPMRARITGNSVLMNRTVEKIARGQLASIAAALFVIYLILAALFTSFRVGLLALLPNALPIAVYFGALGLSGVTLNPSTSLIACIALGIAVDDTIHYLIRFNAEARRTTSEVGATFLALRNVFRPVTFTTLALCLGFLVLASSELRNQVQFGALSAVTLAVAWLFDVTFTPALCAGVRIVTLWDVLRLDLGPEPHLSIPLFEGLSVRQARIFALMSEIRCLAAGESLFREGEKGNDVFVVVEGELSVWIERNGSRFELSRETRGAAVGEVGVFTEQRTANVDALTDVRLLRFTAADLDGLLGRYPRIAAHIFRNLNRTQAARLRSTTERLR